MAIDLSNSTKQAVQVFDIEDSPELSFESNFIPSLQNREFPSHPITLTCDNITYESNNGLKFCDNDNSEPLDLSISTLNTKLRNTCLLQVKHTSLKLLLRSKLSSNK